MKLLFGMLFKWYLFLTTLALFGAHAYGSADLLTGLFLTWIGFSTFSLGLFSSCTDLFHKPMLFKRPNIELPVATMAAVSFGLSLYIVFFYTGKTISEVVTTIVYRESLYNEYQRYFAEQELMVFSLQKLPAIFAAALLKFILLYCFIKILVIDKVAGKKEYISLAIVIVSYLFFSISRGTSFEMFEVMVLFWFCFSIKYIVHNKRKTIFNKSSVVLAFLGIAAVAGYLYNFSARYSFGDTNGCAASEQCSSAVLYALSPAIAEVTNKLSSYFTFGIFFISSFINSLWLASIKNFILGLLPLGFSTINLDISSYVCSELIDCGVMWHPDFARIFQQVGFPGLLLLLFFFGLASRHLVRVIAGSKDIIDLLMLYFIFLSLISLPIGNFIFASSSNILVLFFSVAFFIFTTKRQNQLKEVK